MSYRRKFGSHWYRRIYCFRDRVSAEEYAKRLQKGRTHYTDVKSAQSESKGWWCVYGREL